MLGEKNSQNAKGTTVRWKVYRLLLWILCGLSVGSAAFLIKFHLQDEDAGQYWKRIAGQKGTDQALKSENILPEYQALYERNPDMIGWIKIEGTGIDYPVMQTKRNPEYYLRRNFDREDDRAGTPFADYRCRVIPWQGFNTIIYGHMTSGDSMFRWLLNYSYEGWYQKHKEIQFDTLTERGFYEVVAAFYYDASDVTMLVDGSEDTEEKYEFYNYLEVDSEEGFQRFRERLGQLKLYETSGEIAPTDRLITLVCCAPKVYSGIERNGRFVVVAKRK